MEQREVTIKKLSLLKWNDNKGKLVPFKALLQTNTLPLSRLRSPVVISKKYPKFCNTIDKTMIEKI